MPRSGRVTDTGTRVLLERVWEHGCETGRRDIAGEDAATLASLRDDLRIIEAEIAALEAATPE